MIKRGRPNSCLEMHRSRRQQRGSERFSTSPQRATTAVKHVVVPARGPRASRIPVPLSSSLLKSRREGEQLALRQSACTYRRRSARVVCALPYLTTPSLSLSASRVPRLGPSPSPFLSVPLRLSPHSLLLCFCDLFVSASRVQFSRFFRPLPPAYLSPPFSWSRSRRPPAYTNPQVHRSSRTLLLRANEREGEGEREREITAHRTCTRVPIFCQRHSRRKAARQLIDCVKRQGVRTHVPLPSDNVARQVPDIIKPTTWLRWVCPAPSRSSPRISLQRPRNILFRLDAPALRDCLSTCRRSFKYSFKSI